MVNSTQDIQDQAVLTAALEYLDHGWPVFPLAGANTRLTGTSRILSGKLAASPRYYLSPITSRRLVSAETFSNCGVGIATGRASGLLVLDIDGAIGRASASRLRLPPTRTVETHNGLHLYYAYPDAIDWLPSSPDTLAAGIDVKAEEGFVNAPPSRHPEGGCYRWVDPAAPIATLPPELVDRIRSLPHRRAWKICRRYLFKKYLRFPFNAVTGR